MFLRTILFHTLLNGVCICCLPALAEARQVSITPELRFRAQTFTRESDPIVNPIPWVQFKEMLPEGSRVDKGDVVFRLDIKGVLDGVAGLENRLEEAENDSDQRLSNLRKTVSELEDQRAVKNDDKEIQKARRAYLASLPVEADVEIARGRLRVARSNLGAAEDELETSRERMRAGLISPAMLKEDEDKAAELRARTLYAEQMLRLAELPAHPLEIEIVDFLIRNLELEIDKLDKEIVIQKKILEIETATQERRIADLRAQLAERKGELQHEYLLAPASGVLMYSPQLKRELTVGGKASKGMELAEIPRRESMALEGVIPEQLRHLFRTGDPADIRLNLYPNRTFTGKISSIAPFSKDAVEGDNSSGVKIVDVVVEMDDIPEELPLGVYGWVTLSTARPVSGWAVPASWIRYRGGKAHVSVGGEMKPVNGVLHEEQFVLSSPHPPAEALRAEGEWVNEETQGLQLTTDQFIATGELTPFESVFIAAPRVRAWDIQVAWLVNENSEVKKGDPLIRLDSEQLTRDLENSEMDVQHRKGERESAEEELALRRSEQAFRLDSARNLIEIRKRERDLVLSGGRASEVAETRMNLTTARIGLSKAEEELARGVRNAEWTPESERLKLERALRRRKLEVERAEIRYALAREGATPLAKSAAELALLREQSAAAELTSQQYSSLSRAQSRLRWRKAREERDTKRLEDLKKDLVSMEINAPAAGLVKYLKIWDGVRQSKIKSGMKVYRGMHLLSLSSADQLYVEVPVPERYIRHLSSGLQVDVRIPSEGGMQWKGRIIRMREILEPAGQGNSSPGLYGNQEAPREQVLKVRILIDTGEAATLKSGAIAQIIFPFDK